MLKVRRAFLDGGGEMGVLMRAMDWTRTPLGPIDEWPQSLRLWLLIVGVNVARWHEQHALE